MSGKVKRPTIPATATILPQDAAAQAERLLTARYPIAWRGLGAVNKLIALVRRRPGGQSMYLEIRPR
jgi:hypothetical protein